METLKFQTLGPVGGPALVCLHGFLGTGCDWLPFAQDLQRLRPEIQILLPDLPGHGESVSIPPDNFTERLIESLDAAGTPRAAISGYSLGGRLALAATLHDPLQLRALVLVSSTAGIESDEERRGRRQTDERLADRIESIGTAAFLDEWTAQPMFNGTDIAPEDHAGRLSNSPHSLAQSLRTCGTGVQPSFWGELSGITIPTLIVVGERDTKFTEIGKRLNDQIGGSELIVIPNAGHAVHLDQPEVFISAFEDFVARRVAA